MRSKIISLHKLLKTEETKTKKLLGVAKKSTTSETLVIKENLKRVRSLIFELEKSLKNDIKKIESVCYIDIKYPDGRVSNFYLVKSPVFLKKISFISKSSPIGKVLLGKKPGDKIEFNNQSFDIIAIG